MIIVNDRACNGVDLSHWNTDAPGLIDQDWVKFYGHKATHVGGKAMDEGVDPKFAARRKLATQLDIRWRAFYMWLLPTSTVNAATQVELLARTMGELAPGEAVYLDWEDSEVTRAMIDEFTTYMNLEFPRRWFVYANDATPDMVGWMEMNTASRAVPLMHPNYSDQGLTEAKRWDATIWQTGKGKPPGFTGDVPIDYVLQPDKLDRVCGRTQ
jgi:GH25 family lysozyme M1 (1,4-beta-N-acetylmuramidase)